ncbi:MAG: hypothetical protein CMJ27_08910 [Phycisphaerae bacterium]|nr:hypothetical protein [Phycisphaerae bacterium]OUX01162.1 MAG: hypothetical protein CBD91_05150 [Phycisphaeraceae bacterium TMED231]
MTPVLRWIKSHLVVVICAVIILAAPITAWVISSGMNASLRAELQQTASKVKELDRYRSTTVALEVPGGDPISVRGVVNPRLLEAYESAVTTIGSQAEIVHAAGLERNRSINGRVRTADDILPDHFPAPRSKAGLEEMPFAMHEALVEAYRNLLAEVQAGTPPEAQAVSERLSRRRDVFVSGARKDSVDDLEGDEIDAMRGELAAARLNIYRSHALGEDGTSPIRFYAGLGQMPIAPEPKSMLPLGMMFEWQWDYWVTEDLLHAFAAANGDETVLQGPMKRLVSLNVLPLGAELPEGGGNSGGSGFSGGTPGMGAGGGNPGRRGRGGGNAAAAAPAASGAGAPARPGKARVDPGVAANVDKSLSITGRASNDVYDVRIVECELVVATRGIPKVIDAIAQQNFMTVLDVKIRPANAFSAANGGFIYGIEPVSRVNIRLESVWLREWTADAMPSDLREALGIQSEPNNAAGQAG